MPKPNGKSAYQSPFSNSHFPTENKSQKNSTCKFHCQSCPENKSGHPHDSSHLRSRNRILHRTSLHQPDLSSGQRCDENCYRNHSHTADLDQQKDHCLTETGPVSGRILHNQTCHAAAEVAVKSASAKLAPLPSLVAQGSIRIRLPARIRIANPKMIT